MPVAELRGVAAAGQRPQPRPLPILFVNQPVRAPPEGGLATEYHGPVGDPRAKVHSLQRRAVKHPGIDSLAREAGLNQGAQILLLARLTLTVGRVGIGRPHRGRLDPAAVIEERIYPHRNSNMGGRWSAPARSSFMVRSESTQGRISTRAIG
jgi:hypothetical protein